MAAHSWAEPNKVVLTSGIFLAILGLTVSTIVTWEPCGGDTGGYCYYLGRCHNGDECKCMNGWTGKDCTVPIDCGDISEQLKNVILPPSYYSNYGSLVTYTCKHLYQFPGVANEDALYQRVLRCNEDGKWGPDASSCVAMCPPIPSWDGYIILTDGHSRMEGAEVEYACAGYYQTYHNLEKSLDGEVYYQFVSGKNGTRTTKCGSDGQWDPPIAECELVEVLEAADSTAQLSVSLLVLLASMLLTITI